MKPILFNTEMVRAILAGHKTVTRRVVKPQPHYEIHVGKDRWSWDWVWWGDKDTHDIKAPYCPGDILYVRETWKQATCCPAGGGYALTDLFLYKADEPINTDGMLVEEKWHPSIHMPREAARIFLRVTGVRVERLQDIREDQAIKEGAEREYIDADVSVSLSAKNVFADIWDNTLNSKDRALYGWEANPYVWCVSFEKISKEEAYKCA